jgi:hypothetical protein
LFLSIFIFALLLQIIPITKAIHSSITRHLLLIPLMLAISLYLSYLSYVPLMISIFLFPLTFVMVPFIVFSYAVAEIQIFLSLYKYINLKPSYISISLVTIAIVIAQILLFIWAINQPIGV